MKELVLVALGGALGAMARFKLSLALSGIVMASAIPLGIVVVHTLGCLAAGVNERFRFLSGDAYAFLFAGVLGGFTTFSAFSVETLALLRAGSWGSAVTYICLSVGLGLLAVWIGFVSLKS
jgi:CrcB protein